MPLFKCSKCGAVENTALGSFWTNQNEPLCSECETGKWHGRFSKVYTTDDVFYQDADGFLYLEREVDFDIDENCFKYKNNIKMIGKA